jgi:hypothetical protein
MSLHWPLCVSYQRPPAPAEAVTRRERWIRWRRTPSTEPDPVWAAEPDLKLVEQIANEHKWMCGFSGCKNVSVEFFKEGAINKLYIISAIETHTGNPIERILRSSMPVHPPSMVYNPKRGCNYGICPLANHDPSTKSLYF